MGPVDLLFDQADVLAEFLGESFLEQSEVRAYVSGVSTYTPDGNPVISCDEIGNPDLEEEIEAPKMLSATGCCGYGISWAGGIGEILAKATVQQSVGKTSVIPPDFDAKRFEGWTEEQIIEQSIAFRHSKFLEKSQ